MHANQEIHRVGVEMADLKHLLDATWKLLKVRIRSLTNLELTMRCSSSCFKGSPRSTSFFGFSAITIIYQKIAL
jgi:hypothetical protein